MKMTDLTDSTTANAGAFCPAKLAEEGINTLTLITALTDALSPFAGLLKDGHGFGAYVNGEDGSVIGFTAPSE